MQLTPFNVQGGKSKHIGYMTPTIDVDDSVQHLSSNPVYEIKYHPFHKVQENSQIKKEAYKSSQSYKNKQLLLILWQTFLTKTQ